MNKHQYHLVDNSVWPLMVAFSLFSLAVSFVLSIGLYSKGIFLINLSILSLLLIVSSWWQNVITEATYLGDQNEKVIKGIYYAIILFIISEIFLFIGLFWAYIHSALNNTPALGALWPPFGIDKINPIELPLLNTLLLLSAGFSVTWSHHAYITNNNISNNKSTSLQSADIGFIIGILFAFIFTLFQVIEYKTCGFDLSDSSFGSCFYLATSLHGIHVLIGAIFLLTSFLRFRLYHFSRIQHTNLICSLWYFHFTDAVWIFLFILMYLWGFN